MKTPTIHHVTKDGFDPNNSSHLYIGRKMPIYYDWDKEKGLWIIRKGDQGAYDEKAIPPYQLAESKWANLFRIKKKNDPDQRFNSILLYLEDISGKILLEPMIYDLKELDGKMLFCWCKPFLCHGDVLIWLFKSKFNV